MNGGASAARNDFLAALPGEDRTRSPYTGWTRTHWETAADRLLDAAAPYASNRGAFFHLPGPRPSASGRTLDGLEGFARTFLLAAFRLAGSGGAAPGRLAERYAEGLVAGTQRRRRESWPAIIDHSQAIVESAAIALALAFTKPSIWDALDAGAQERIASWLWGVNRVRVWDNNWLLFPVLVNAFLQSVDVPHDAQLVSRNLDRVDALYRGDGWYTDGAEGNFDHYNAWGFHFCTVLWCRLDGDRDPERAARYRDRCRRFLADYRLLIGGNGAPVHYGRSLVYRFAALAPFWAGALEDATPLPPGETRRLASGMLRHFLENGAAEDGVLSLGWHRAFSSTAQPYSGPASPYWAATGFLGLLLQPEDPVWSAVEQPLAVEQSDFERGLEAPSFLISGTRADGIVRLLTHGRPHTSFVRDGHYRRLVYSTHTAPENEAGATAVDAEVVAEATEPARAVAIRLKRGVIRSERRFESGSITCASTFRGPTEVRVVRATGGGALRTGGVAVADSVPPETEAGARWASARTASGLVSTAIALHGFDSADVSTSEGTNALGRFSATPVLSSHEAPAGAVHVALFVLSGERVDPEVLLAAADVREASIHVIWPDGHRVVLPLE